MLQFLPQFLVFVPDPAQLGETGPELGSAVLDARRCSKRPAQDPSDRAPDFLEHTLELARHQQNAEQENGGKHEGDTPRIVG